MDADTLRLLLIIAGGLLLGGLYVWERRRVRSEKDEPYERNAPDDDKREPQLDAWTDEAGDEVGDPAADDHARKRPESPLPPARPQLEPKPPAASPRRGPVRPESPVVLSLHITPKRGIFDGEAIVRAAGRCGIESGEMDIFHRYADAESTEHPVFSMANMVKPGTFPFGAMDEFESPGLTLFSEVEGAPDDPSRLEAMLTTARCLADTLKAEIRDGTRALLTPESEERLRDRVHELMAWRLADADPQ